MKKILTALMLVAVVIGGIFVARPAFAEDHPNCTSILPSGLCDEDNGQGVKDLLSMVVDIMMAGVGILGVIGITIVGIQYLTAAGDVSKTTKAKRRIFEIAIGVAAFILLGAIIKFLAPSL